MTHLSLLSFRLSSPGSFSFSMYERCSSHFITLWSFMRHCWWGCQWLVVQSSVFCLLSSSSCAVTPLSGWRSPAETCSSADVCVKDLPAHAHDASLTACQSQITPLAFCFPFPAKLADSAATEIQPPRHEVRFLVKTQKSVFIYFLFCSGKWHCPLLISPATCLHWQYNEKGAESLTLCVTRNSFLSWA